MGQGELEVTQEQWREEFKVAARAWYERTGGSVDASWETIDRAISRRLDLPRGASASTVKKWRTGQPAFPSDSVIGPLDELLGTDGALAAHLEAVRAQLPAEPAPPAVEPDAPPPAAHEATDAELGDGDGDGDGGNRLRRRLPVIGAAAVVLLAIGLVTVLVSARTREDDTTAPATTSTPQDCTVGRLSDELMRQPAATAWSDALAQAYQRGGVGCPTGPARRWEQLIVQELTTTDGLTAALVVVSEDPDRTFALNPAQWGSYHQLGGKNGGGAQVVGGLPVSVETRDGHVEIVLSTGTVLVAERADAPYFPVLAAYVDWWRQHPELGLPMSSPRFGTVSRQDLQHGFATIDITRIDSPEAHLDADPTSELPPQVRAGGVIITEADETSWWVPAPGERQWIADGATWNCLGGPTKKVGEAVPGAAVATLRYTGIATCR